MVIADRRAALALVALLLAGCAGGPPAPTPPPAPPPEPVMRPADPQPGSLRPGLTVRYAYPGEVRTLGGAGLQRGNAEPGPPLAGMNHPNTLRGQPTLTSKRAERVVAFIDGFIRFEEAGEHVLEFRSNDGLRVEIGGVRVYGADGRRSCSTVGPVEIDVPAPGWYPFEALFFQRLNTSCLGMRIQRPSDDSLRMAPDRMFGRQG